MAPIQDRLYLVRVRQSGTHPVASVRRPEDESAVEYRDPLALGGALLQGNAVPPPASSTPPSPQEGTDPMHTTHTPIGRTGLWATLIACAIGTCGSSAAQAATYTWSAASGSRPDVGGSFTRVATGSASDTLLPGGVLQLNSGAFPEHMHYLASGAQLAMPEQLVIEFTTRYVAGSSASTLRSPLMVSANFDGGAGALLKIEPNNAAFIRGDDLSATPGSQLLPGTFQHYRLTFFGQAAGDAVRLDIDGVPRYTYSLQQNPNSYPGFARIWFGDGTLVAGGTSEWLDFSHNAAAVPEPADAALWLAGLLAIGALKQRHATRSAS